MGRSRMVRSPSPRQKKQRIAKHKTNTTKSYRVELPTCVPRDVRLSIVGVIDKTAKQLKFPFRQQAWYPTSDYLDLHHLQYEVWMTHRKVQWMCALYAPCTDTDRHRETKADAKKARLQLLSACVVIFVYYGFLQRLEENVHDTLMRLGGREAQRSATASRSGVEAEVLQKGLVTFFKKKDKTAFHRVISKALNPFSIDENGFATLPELLEQSGALYPEKISYLRLTTRALAGIVLDVTRGRSLKEFRVGNKSSGPWKKLLSDHSVLEEAKKICSAQKADLYEPELRNIDFAEDDDNSNFDDENSQFTGLPPTQSSLSDDDGSLDGDNSSDRGSDEKSPPPKSVKNKAPPLVEVLPTNDPPAPTKSSTAAKSK
ncbi:hypothetical protein PHMEG_00020663 [Phytophthora megakarya]|uniref:Uncharacterized protein n=1 Tax=Phytophthora megakarya TaxID=4795 RepID=A0A225VNS6_9STRA|nr:hypothetical protein PHMEG_00020663 [Phytophthora megakarya]